MDLTSNFFLLFGLPESFELDDETLSLRYRDLQRQVHPDRYASAPEPERRLSVQLAARINEGYGVLRSPLARARYLLELRGHPLDDTDTRMEPEFLMEQMELRDQLDDVRSAADPFAALEQIRGSIEGRERLLLSELVVLFREDEPSLLEQARQGVRKLQFMQRLLDEAADLEDDLVHASS